MAALTNVHSNAFNFLSSQQHSVDPRTGQYNVGLDIPELQANDLSGPTVPLKLRFNALNNQDSGFGIGWSLNLSQYTLSSQMLSLHTGDSFRVDATDALGQPVITEQKLSTFQFYKDADRTYRVVHRSGLVEILHAEIDADVAMSVAMYSPAGHKVSLEYADASYKGLLTRLTDANGELLTIKRNADTVDIKVHPHAGIGGEALATYTVNIAGGRVQSVILPSQDKASWRFTYKEVRGYTCLTEVTSPVGGHETLEYGDLGHLYPDKIREALPRVTVHRVDPGFTQPSMVVNYAYTAENFIGNGASIVWGEGLDNLYGAPDNYRYGTTATSMDGEKALRTVARTFNRFHLLLSEVTTQGLNIKETLTAYHDQPNTVFKDQPAQFQLPKTVDTRWRIEGDATRFRTERLSMTFDTEGNPLEEIQPSGIRTVHSYYPKDGADGCPADPQGFVRNRRDTTVYPARLDARGLILAAAPVLQTRYRYTALDSLADLAVRQSGQVAGYWLLVASEELVDVDRQQPLRFSGNDYHRDISSPYSFGRLSQQSMSMNDKTTSTDYAYEKLYSSPVEIGPWSGGQHLTSYIDYAKQKVVYPQAGDTVHQTTATINTHDNVCQLLITQQSSLTGKDLLSRDANGVSIRFTYDALDRITSETVAPGTEFEATRTYRYYLTSVASQQASQVLTDVKGVQTHSYLDGLNRTIKEARHNADNPLRADELRVTYAARHNALGDLLSETEFDWLDDLDLPLTSSFEYDDWGMQRCLVRPDGVREYSDLDPIGSVESKGPIQRTWQHSSLQPAPRVEVLPEQDSALASLFEYFDKLDTLQDFPSVESGVTETWLNAFDKPMLIQRFDIAANPVSLHEYFYDGLGRTAREIDAADNAQSYVYDAFGRLRENGLADGSIVERHYVLHSDADLPTEIAVTANGQTRVLGLQRFDGLARLIESSVGGRKSLYVYQDDQLEPYQTITPAGQVIEYEYRPQLSGEPIKRSIVDTTKAANAGAAYEYDAQNARLLNCTEQGHALTRRYFSTGHLQSETRQEQGDAPTMQHYRYSLLGRLLAYTDVQGNEQRYRYDDYGRLLATEIGSTTVQMSWDALGRLAKTETRDGVQRLDITVGYDDFSRETTRHFESAQAPTQTLLQDYDGLDKLVASRLSQGDEVLREESYAYDSRGRLATYRCTGAQAPHDAAGNQIIEQVFVFDAIDNVTRVLTRSTAGSNTSAYSYTNTDPTQLTKIASTLAGYPNLECSDSYDANGHLTVDEAQRTLAYDGLGRLMSVAAAGDGLTSQNLIYDYRYDALDRLAGQDISGIAQQRFYCDSELASVHSAGIDQRFVRGGGCLFAAQSGANDSALLAVDQRNSVLGTANSSLAYSAYGYSADQPSSDLAYNGEYREGQTGCYLLGNGYRAYNPVLMRFHSPDSASPFGVGGLNAYGYCVGDPVNHTDPTGHFGSLFAGLALLAVSAGMSYGATKTDGTVKTILVIGAIMTGILAVGLVSTGGRYNPYRSQTNVAGLTRRQQEIAIELSGRRPRLRNPENSLGPEYGLQDLRRPRRARNTEGYELPPSYDEALNMPVPSPTRARSATPPIDEPSTRRGNFAVIRLNRRPAPTRGIDSTTPPPPYDGLTLDVQNRTVSYQAREIRR